MYKSAPTPNSTYNPFQTHGKSPTRRNHTENYQPHSRTTGPLGTPTGLYPDESVAAALQPWQTAAATARQRGVRNVVCGTLEDVGFADGSLPSAAAVDVLEHLADDRASLALIHKLLRPQGRLYITVPAYQFLFSDEDQFAGHFRRYTLASLSEAVRGAGFQVKYASYIFPFLPLPVFLFRTIPSRLKRITEVASSERLKADHAGPRQFHFAMDVILRAEVAAVEGGRRIPFGGSCLLVATKSITGV